MPSDKDFKVIDKRSQEKDKKAEGQGFTMKEGESEKPVTPQDIDFSTLIFSFATGAMINMGLAPDPSTNKKQKNLEIAKQNIDILVMLQNKTKGNLSPDESKLIESLLTEVRLRFVEASR